MSEPDANRQARDTIGIAGMVVVGLAAAVLSFSTWVQLAESVGFGATWTVHPPYGPAFTIRLAWLLPLAVDCYTLTVIRVWLNLPAASAVVRYAKGNAVAAIVLTVLAQAVYHAFAAAGFEKADLWWFAIVIGGIPPLLLGLVMDLYTRLKHEQRDVAETTTAPTVQPAAPAPERRPAAPTIRRPTRPTNRTNGRPNGLRRAAPPAGVHAIGEPGDDDLMPHVHPIVETWAATHGGEPPGQHTVRNALKTLDPPIHIGLKRAGRLVERAVREPRTQTSGGKPADDPKERHDALVSTPA